MPKAIIIINAEVSESGKVLVASEVTKKMLAALKSAVERDGAEAEVIAAGRVWSNSWTQKEEKEIIYCPLTIDLPDSFAFPAKGIYKACFEIKETRLWVQEHLKYKVISNKNFMGDLWLPIVLTAKGPVYGEVIAEGPLPNAYEQPVDLSDEIRRGLYGLGFKLLNYLNAIPSVYLLQFSWKGELIFDRLWPFPAAAALASLGVQQPDLFTCYWRCLTAQPIYDLRISGMKG